MPAVASMRGHGGQPEPGLMRQNAQESQRSNAGFSGNPAENPAPALQESPEFLPAERGNPACRIPGRSPYCATAPAPARQPSQGKLHASLDSAQERPTFVLPGLFEQVESLEQPTTMCSLQPHIHKMPNSRSVRPVPPAH
jgi:hypothetical protein